MRARLCLLPALALTTGCLSNDYDVEVTWTSAHQSEATPAVEITYGDGVIFTSGYDGSIQLVGETGFPTMEICLKVGFLYDVATDIPVFCEDCTGTEITDSASDCNTIFTSTTNVTFEL